MLGVFISIGTAYLVMQFSSIIIYVQVLVTFFILPLFAAVILGMLWKGATPAGGFFGLLVGISSSIGMWLWVKNDPSALKYVALSEHAKDMAENMYRGLWTLIISVVVIVALSLVTKPKPAHELKDLVYGLTPLPSEGDYPLWQRPIFWAGVVAVILVAINVVLW
jgi:SSS family solute:Na+ symporter